MAWPLIVVAGSLCPLLTGVGGVSGWLLAGVSASDVVTALLFGVIGAGTMRGCEQLASTILAAKRGTSVANRCNVSFSKDMIHS